MNVPACEKVLMKLKTECIEYLKKYASIEEIIRRDMKEMIKIILILVKAMIVLVVKVNLIFLTVEFAD